MLFKDATSFLKILQIVSPQCRQRGEFFL
jgi:hypothetical protein